MNNWQPSSPHADGWAADDTRGRRLATGEGQGLQERGTAVGSAGLAYTGRWPITDIVYSTRAATAKATARMRMQAEARGATGTLARDAAEACGNGSGEESPDCAAEGC